MVNVEFKMVLIEQRVVMNKEKRALKKMYVFI